MSLSGWLDANRNRAYPFVAGTVGVPSTFGLQNLPDGIVVDAGFIANAGSGFISGEHRIFLARISRIGYQVVFYFSGDAPGFAANPLIFVRGLIEPRFTTTFSDSLPVPDPQDSSENAEPGEVDAGTPNPLKHDLDDCALPAWSGFLTLGDTTELSTWLPDNASYVSDGTWATLEPAQVQNQSNCWVEAIGVANLDRTRAPSTGPSCVAFQWPFALQESYIWERCVQGDVRFIDGSNTEVNQTVDGITITARPGAGAGTACEDIPVFPHELSFVNPAIPSTTGALLCSGVLRSVNGIGGPNLPILAGSGVSVVEDSLNNRVLIHVGTNSLGSCLNTYSRVSDSLPAM